MVLKIVGITILAIFAAVLLLILLVLFWPLRYRASGKYDGSGTCVSGKISWFFGLALLKVKYENGKPFELKARILFITVFNSAKRESIGSRLKQWIKRGKTRQTEPELKAASIHSEDVYEDNASVDEDVTADGKKDVYEREILRKTDVRKNDFNEDDELGDDVKKEGFFEKIKKFFQKLIEFVDNIKFTFHQIYVIMVKVRNNIKYYWELLHKDSTKKAISLCSRQFSKIFKNISPKKYEIKLHLGFDDPAVMGNVLAVWGMLYPFHLGRVDIIPEFDRKVIEGSFRLKGRVTVYVLLWAAWVIMTDKNIKRLRRQLDI